MSKEDFDKVQQRLEQAKQEMAWVLAVLHDQDLALKGYHLSADEKQQVVQKSLQGMTELLLPLSQQLAKHPESPIESATLAQMEHLHLSQYDFKKVVKSGEIVSIEVVSPRGGPRRSPKDSRRKKPEAIPPDGGPRRPPKDSRGKKPEAIPPGGPPRRPLKH